MSYLIKPAGYRALLNLSQTEMGIKKIKDFFQQNLSSELRLRRVTAPLFVLKGMGINDDLNGTERAVTFPIKDLDDSKAEIVHSLAKWKRLTLADYQIEKGYGIYTDMNAIRSDEELGNLHSLYVDQWDWERVMGAEERNVDFLKEIVRRIYAAMVRTEYLVYEMFPEIRPTLPQHIHFIHSEELLLKYPTFTPKEREDAITKEYGAVFIIGIGCQLSNGKKHDGRAPDYDDSCRKRAGRIEWRFACLGRSAEPLDGTFIHGYPCRQRSIAPPIGDMRCRRKERIILPQTPPERRTAIEHRWWYRTKPPVYVLPAQSPYRRNPGKYMAGRHAPGSPCCRHVPYLIEN
jgi:hypothetical protein